MDYHNQDGIEIKAFIPLLEEVEKAFSAKEYKGLDVPLVNDTNCNGTKPDSPLPTTTPPPLDSNPIFPSSTTSGVTSPFSGGTLTLANAQQEVAFTNTISKAVTDSDCDEEVASPIPCSPQATRPNEEWPEKYDLKQKLNQLCCYIEEKLSKHLFIFDIAKPELEEHLR